MTYKKLILGVLFWRVFKRVALSNHVKIFFLNICPYKKKLISGESIWGPLGGGGTSIVCQTICCLNIYQYKQKTITLAWAIKKISF